LTDAGFAMLAEVGDAVTLIVGVIVGVCTGLVCWVQPGDKKTGNDAETHDNMESVFRYHDYTVIV